MKPQAVTVHDEKTVTALTRASLSRKADPKFGVAARIGIFAGLVVLSSILFAFAKEWGYIIIVAVLLLMVAAILVTRYLYRPKQVFKGYGKLRNIKTTFTFLPDSMTVYSSITGFKEECTFSYDNINLVKETSDYFIVYRSADGEYIIDKSHLYNCDVDTVRLLLTSGKAKYILCNY